MLKNQDSGGSSPKESRYLIEQAAFAGNNGQ
jgi:hypothetical protein